MPTGRFWLKRQIPAHNSIAHTQENVKKVLRIENKRKQISFHNFPIHYETSGLTMRVMPFTQKSPVSV